MENVKLRKAGYSFRQPFQKFLNRYNILLKTSGPPKAQCEAILKKHDAGSDQWTLGKTVVFMREKEVLYLENQILFHTLGEEFKTAKTQLSSWIQTTSATLKKTDSLNLNNLLKDFTQSRKLVKEKLDRVYRLKGEYSDKLYDYDEILRLAREGQNRGVPNVDSQDITTEWTTLSKEIEEKSQNLKQLLKQVDEKEEEEKRLAIERELQKAKEETERKKQEEEKKKLEEELEKRRKEEEEEEKRRQEEDELRKQEVKTFPLIISSPLILLPSLTGSFLSLLLYLCILLTKTH